MSGHDGPVLLAAPDVPALSAFHTRAAVDDMAAGVTLSSAPALDGRPYLIAIGSADPALIDLVREPFEAVVAAVVEQDGELGLIRPERRLATLADAHALLADPMTPPEIAAILAHLR